MRSIPGDARPSRYAIGVRELLTEMCSREYAVGALRFAVTNCWPVPGDDRNRGFHSQRNRAQLNDLARSLGLYKDRMSEVLGPGTEAADPLRHDKAQRDLIGQLVYSQRHAAVDGRVDLVTDVLYVLGLDPDDPTLREVVGAWPATLVTGAGPTPEEVEEIVTDEVSRVAGLDLDSLTHMS